MLQNTSKIQQQEGQIGLCLKMYLKKKSRGVLFALTDEIMINLRQNDGGGCGGRGERVDNRIKPHPVTNMEETLR